MSEEKVSVDRRIDSAVREVAKLLVKRGMEPTAAKALAEKHRGRLVAGEAGPIYTTNVGGGEVHSPSYDEPFKELVTELYYAAPAEVKLGASEVAQAANKERMRRSGMY